MQQGVVGAFANWRFCLTYWESSTKLFSNVNEYLDIKDGKMLNVFI